MLITALHWSSLVDCMKRVSCWPWTNSAYVCVAVCDSEVGVSGVRCGSTYETVSCNFALICRVAFRIHYNVITAVHRSSLLVEWCMMVSYCVEHQLITPSNSITHTQQYKRTCCSSRANTAPIPYIQPTKINTSRVITIVVYSESKMAHEVKLHTAPYCIEHQ